MTEISKNKAKTKPKNPCFLNIQEKNNSLHSIYDIYVSIPNTFDFSDIIRKICI